MKRALLPVLATLFALIPNTPAGATDLILRKSASVETTTVGTPFFYFFEIDNTSTFGGGPIESPNTMLFDSLPPEVRFVSAAPDQGSCTFSDQKLSCNLGTIPVDAVVGVTVTVDPFLPGTAFNEAEVRGPLFDPAPANNFASTTVVIEERTTASDISISKEPSLETVDVGDELTYSLTITNDGPDDAVHVIVTDPLPAGLDFAGASDGCTHDLGVVTCVIDRVPVGESITLLIHAEVVADGEITNVASVDHETDPNDSNDTASATVTSVSERVDISVSKTANRLAYVGEELVYNIHVTNNGPDDVEGVSLVDTLPADSAGKPFVDVVSVVPSDSCSEAAGAVNCDLSDLPAGQTRTITIVVNPIVRATVVNSVTVTADGDLDLSDNTSTAETYITRHGSTVANAPLSEDAADPVSTASGEFYLQEEADLFAGGPLPLFFSRYYASGLDADERLTTDLGPNWSHNFAWRIVRYDDDVVEVITPRGAVLPFEKREGVWVFTGDAVAPYQLGESGSTYQLASPRSGTMYRFDETGRLLSVSDRNGNERVLTYDGDHLVLVSDGLGRELVLAYSGDRISSVSDGSRTVRFGYSANSRLGSVEDAIGRETQYGYDASRDGLLTQVVRPGGVTVVDQQYDAEGRVTSQTDAFGGTTRLAYDGNQTTITNGEGEVVRHVYDDSGRLLEMVDPTGDAVRLQYDEEGRRIAVEDRSGVLTTMEHHEPTGFATVLDRGGSTTRAVYDARTVNGFEFYDVASLTLEDGAVVTYEYDQNGNVTAIVEESGRRTEAQYNSRGQVISITSPGGAATQFTYTSGGLPASVIGPDGATLTFSYDALGRMSTVTFPDGSTRRFEFDDADRLTALTNERGQRFTYDHDVRGNIIRITDPQDGSLTLSYNDAGRITGLTDREGHTTLLEYDDLGRPTSITNALMERMQLAYDAAGLMSNYIDAAGASWQYDYDDEGLLVATTNPLGHAFRLNRDQQSRVVGIERPDGSTLSFTHDARGRVTSTTTPDGATSTFMYDPSDRLTSVSIPGGQQATYSRDGAGNLTALNAPNGGTWSFERDNLGRIVTEADPAGNQTSFSYDVRGRLSRVDLPGSNGSISYGYDEQGNTVRLDHSDGTSYTYAYDARGRLVSATDVSISRDANGSIVGSNGLTIGRDALRRMSRVDLPAGSVQYTYDAVGNVRQVEDWLGGITTFTYDDARRRNSVTRPNGVRSNVVRDEMNRLVSENVVDAEGNALWSMEVDRDVSGRVTRAAVSPALAPRPEPDERAYAFDEAYRNEAFSYDELGRRRSDDRLAYEWSGASRLTSIESDAGSVRFTYDALGRKISRTDGEGMRTYTWNEAFSPAVVSVEMPESGAARYYVHLPDGELLYFVEEGSRYFYHFDHAGSTIFLTDDAGEMAAAYAYGPYGRPAGVIGDVENPFTFHARYGLMHEVDGLYYARARFYDAMTGQFVSRDPLRAIDPVHVNPYQFVVGNPVSFGDPTGLEELTVENPGEAIATVLQDLISAMDVTIDFTKSVVDAERFAAAGDDLGQIAFAARASAEEAKSIAPVKTILSVLGGFLTFGVEFAQSGNALRGGGAVVSDLALGATPITTVGAIASDIVDAGAYFAGAEQVKLKEPIANAGRLAGAAATDLIAVTGILGEHRKSSLTQLAQDIEGQDGLVPNFLKETGATIGAIVPLEHLFGDQNIERISVDAKESTLRRTAATAALRKFVGGGN